MPTPVPAFPRRIRHPGPILPAGFQGAPQPVIADFPAASQPGWIPSQAIMRFAKIPLVVGPRLAARKLAGILRLRGSMVRRTPANSSGSAQTAAGRRWITVKQKIGLHSPIRKP